MRAHDNPKRRLAAILAIDLAGYSRMMERDEAGTLARLQACRRDILNPAIRRRGGRVVKSTGDGFLIEFPSAIDGVECAVEIQRVMQDMNADAAGEPFTFRIGVNVGDLIIEGADIFGDGVNIAARIEGLATPGGVLISRTVRDQIRGKLPYEFVGRTDEAETAMARIRDAQRKLLSVAVTTKRAFQAVSPRGQPYRDKFVRILIAAGVPD